MKGVDKAQRLSIGGNYSLGKRILLKFRKLDADRITVKFSGFHSLGLHIKKSLFGTKAIEQEQPPI